MFKITFALVVLAAGSLQARFYEHKERSLGPTGLFGVTSPTSITITKVSEGSPAAGKMKPGDVVIGAGSTPFKDCLLYTSDAADE